MDETPNTPRKIKYQRPRGTYDILPEDWVYLDMILNSCQEMARFYGFQRIETPIFENAEIFTRGIGAGTDIVEKEMFLIKGGRKKPLALRPEGTAGLVRAYIEKGMGNWIKPVRLWHFGPFFRHEKPQAGRFRQFWQFGFESFGRQNPIIDAQTVQIIVNVLRKLQIKDTITHINSIGCDKCRPRYLKKLKDYLEPYREYLCLDCKKRLKSNILRTLDCKNEGCHEILANAPQTFESLCKKCRQHFKGVLEFIETLELPYELDHSLVRGLDYYNRTVFEIFAQEKDKAKIALAGGGRYDDLIDILGGNPSFACGAAVGVERVIQLMREKSVKVKKSTVPQLFLAQLGISAKREALQLFEKFRKANVLIAKDFSRDSLKSQLSKANRLGIRYVLILGQKEVLEGEIILRDMKTKTQKKIELDKVVEKVKKKIK